MKKLCIYAVITALFGSMTGCLEDDNNYNYEKINTIQKSFNNFQNIEIDYSIICGEELKLAPTFKFTIDSINPDVSYEWYLDRELLVDETGPAYTFASDKSGTYEVTFAVVDNKSGVKHAVSTKVYVRAVYQRGWTILSNEGGRSVLHFIVPSTYKYEATYDGKTFTRDSLVYNDVRRDIVPGLGMNPVGLFNNVGNMDYYSVMGISLYDELIVQQDQWVELNGNTLEREVYTYQEFKDDLPADFSPVEAAMTYSAKVLRDKNGLIYWNNKGDVSDFHAGFYTSVGLNNNTKFKRLFQAYKLNYSHTKIILALTEDNSFVGLFDEASNKSDYTSSVIPEGNTKNSGNIGNIKSSGDIFSNIKKEVVEVLPAYWDPSYGYDVTTTRPYWAALMRDKGSINHSLWFFGLEVAGENINCRESFETSLGTFSDYRDMTVFSNKHYVVIADGNQLYYSQYGADKEHHAIEGKLLPLGNAFPSKIKSLSSNDPNFAKNYPYSGQLGVALEDGSFYIFGVEEVRNATDVCTSASLKQVFPNENTSEENKKFGTIVDVLYKIGRSFDMLAFSF